MDYSAVPSEIKESAYFSINAAFLPQALLQVTQALLEAIQILAGPVLIEDTT